MQHTIQLPPREAAIAFHRLRWSEVLADPSLVDLPFRIETNAHGTLLMNPPPSGVHSQRQGEITFQLRQRLGGRSLPECPVLTIAGVRAADVGWYSDARFRTVDGQLAFETAPEICVEILSPNNTESEMFEKKQLYFEAGAEEVWLCDVHGRLQFYSRSDPHHELRESPRVPDFPSTL